LKLSKNFTFTYGESKRYAKHLHHDNWRLYFQDGEAWADLKKEYIVGYFNSKTFENYKPDPDLWNERIERMKNA
jgi:restriction endonuclease Mrr